MYLLKKNIIKNLSQSLDAGACDLLNTVDGGRRAGRQDELVRGGRWGDLMIVGAATSNKKLNVPLIRDPPPPLPPLHPTPASLSKGLIIAGGHQIILL